MTVPTLLLLLALLTFVVSVAISWRKGVTNFTDLGLALLTAALLVTRP